MDLLFITVIHCPAPPTKPKGGTMFLKTNVTDVSYVGVTAQ